MWERETPALVAEKVLPGSRDEGGGGRDTGPDPGCRAEPSWPWPRGDLPGCAVCLCGWSGAAPTPQTSALTWSKPAPLLGSASVPQTNTGRRVSPAQDWFPIFFFKKKMDLFFTAPSLHCCMGFSLVAERGGYSLDVSSVVWSRGARPLGLSGCSSRAQEHTQQFRHMGLVAPQHLGSSWIRD